MGLIGLESNRWMDVRAKVSIEHLITVLIIHQDDSPDCGTWLTFFSPSFVLEIAPLLLLLHAPPCISIGKIVTE